MPEGPLTDEQRKSVTELATRYRDQNSLTNRRLAKMVGVSASALSQVLAGKYKGDTDRILRELAKLRLRPPPTAADPTDRCVETQFALDIWARVQEGADLALGGEPRMVLVVAPSGSGKSVALQACAQEFPEAIYLELDAGCSTRPAFLRELAMALKCTKLPHYTQFVFKYIIKTLKNSCRLLIVDEVHHGGIEVLNVIRQIMDKTGCPVVLAGQPVLETLIRTSRSDRSHGNTVYSRIGPRLNADNITATRAGRDPQTGKPCQVRQRDLLHTPDDVLKVLKRMKIRVHRPAIRLLTFLANHPDSGMLRTLVFLATRTARLYPDQQLTEQMFRESMEDTFMIEEFEHLYNELTTSELASRITIEAVA